MNNNFNNFNNMDDIFNQLMGNMGGYSTERRRYSINGREVTPENLPFTVRLVACHRQKKWLKHRLKVR